MAASAYITGAFVTFLYSLQWGGEKSSQWLTAFILGTSGGVFIGEPCQPTKAFIKFETPPVWPGNIDDADREADSAFNSTAMDRKLITVSKNIFLYTMYILLVAVICGHNAITQSYDQSNMMRKYLTPVREIYSSEDMWNWLINNYTNMMYPKRYPNLASRLLEGRHYMFDDVSYRIGLSRIRQKRVKGACDIPSLMQSVIERCNSLYSSDVEDNSNYCPGWKEFLPSCEGKGFDFTETISTFIFPLWGLFGFYDSSGYSKLLDPRDSDVRNELFHLKQKNWIDEKTRLVIVETVIFNINSKLFTFIQLYFEYASMGGVYINTRVETMRLYPYIDSFDFLVLGLQIIFVLVTLTRMFHLPFELWKKKKTCCRSVETWIEVLSVCTSICAAVIFTVRVIETISAVEELVNHPDKFVSFQTAADLDVMFKFCISVEMFIAMLKLLKPLTFSYYLYVMRTSIVTSGTELASFSFMIMVIMTAYAIAFTINIGPYNSEFKSIGSAYFALFQILLSHLSYNEVFEKDIEMLVGKLLFGLFVIMMGIFIINIFIAILTDAFNRVQKSMEGKTNCIQTLYVPPFDEELNRYFWMKVDGHLNFVRNILSSSKSWYPNKPPEETKITGILFKLG
ncbi:hypothetical protein FSP39_002520 [Pinctada imbricata]|uniref:Uncharacterized protein n=1 Tax=Pinctada imbricata TaxID=66713 RepID=A0AA88XM93_PINIB|nr:hypothetical protein FSP39_002520 [Pinctada imbricata]